MTRKAGRTDPAGILDVVIRFLDKRGYDGWQLLEVAERAHVSLATIYKHFPSRDELIVAAVERWMGDNVYPSIAEQPAGASVFDALRHMFTGIFEPWERHPAMLEVFVRACTTTPGRERLRAQGNLAVEPLREGFASLDPALAEDVDMILRNVVEGLVTRYAVGEIAISDIEPAVQRTVDRLEQAAAASAASSRGALSRTATRSLTARRRGTDRSVANG